LNPFVCYVVVLMRKQNYHLGLFLSFQVKLTKLKEMEVTHNSWPDATRRRTASNHHHCTHYHFPHQRRLIADSKTPPLPRERSLFLEPPVFFLSVANTNSLHSAWIHLTLHSLQILLRAGQIRNQRLNSGLFSI
jgi:hypothetical protein